MHRRMLLLAPLPTAQRSRLPLKKKMKRPFSALLLLLALLCATASLAFGAEEKKPASRPNFVFIYTDDQRWDAVSVVQREQGARARFPWFKTPNLDRLAAEGVRFRNAFVVNALCAPSRATFLTGRYGHANGVVNNHTPFPTENVTHASLLRGAGYRTGYVGKWHMGSQRGQRPGFDYSASFIGQGTYFNCPFEINGTATPTQGWVDDVSTEYAVQFIKENRERPFSLTLGFKTCHGPFQPPDRFKDTYAGEQARTVPNLGSPAIYRAGSAPNRPAPADGLVPTNLGYFRTLTAMDENVGKLLQVLDELELAANTVVIFTSDNGYYLGEHGLGDKRSAYEESMRVPLLVRYPRLPQKGRVVDQLALNVDLAPTLLDFAGVSIPKEMDGRSWRPLLEGGTTNWRNAFFYSYYYEENFAIPTVTAVRTETAKLIRYPGHDEWTELFDLSQDPYETRNLIADPAAEKLRNELTAEYARQRDAIGWRVPEFADKPEQETVSPALRAWVLEYRFDQDQGDRITDASGKNNHGTSTGTLPAEGRNGAKARQFNGQAFINVPKSPSLNPAVAGWTVDVVFRADRPEGVIVASGGQTNGYSLWLDEGKPVFTVASQSRAGRVAAAESVVGKWVRVTARLTASGQLSLQLDGKPAGTARAPGLIRREPNDNLQIGADNNSPVVEATAGKRFAGLMESVRLYSGEAP